MTVEEMLSMVLAVVLGGILGFERELSGKAAGLRTNVLICMGAAAFTLISKAMAGPDDSASRIAAQVVSGIGFLGAGAIIQDRGGVHGLTTAATIWLVASVGVCCGAQKFILASVITVIAFTVLLGFGKIEKKFRKSRKSQNTLP